MGDKCLLVRVILHLSAFRLLTCSGKNNLSASTELCNLCIEYLLSSHFSERVK